MLLSLFLPLASITFLTPPPGASAPADALPGDGELSHLMVWAAVAVIWVAVLLAIWRAAPILLRRKPVVPLRRVVVDGSNVMHWKDDTPQIETVQAVVHLLQQRGFQPGVVFDANAGYKLGGRHMNDPHLARLLGLPVDQVLVVPSGTPADLFILAAARDFGAPVVSRDKFRDWAADYPEVTTPGFLIRGGYRKTGELWLDEAVAQAERAVS